MNPQFWTCCGRNYTATIAKCRKCGKQRPNYGFVDNKTETKEEKTPISRDPLISKDEKQLFVSTIKFEKDEKK